MKGQPKKKKLRGNLRDLVGSLTEEPRKRGMVTEKYEYNTELQGG